MVIFIKSSASKYSICILDEYRHVGCFLHVFTLNSLIFVFTSFHVVFIRYPTLYLPLFRCNITIINYRKQQHVMRIIHPLTRFDKLYTNFSASSWYRGGVVIVKRSSPCSCALWPAPLITHWMVDWVTYRGITSTKSSSGSD